MNKQILKAKWKQARGGSRWMRGKLLKRNRDRLSGRAEMTLGRLQERYVKSRVRVTRSIRRYSLLNKSRSK